MALGAFASGGFQPGGFQVALPDRVPARGVDQRNIPRWLVRLERIGRVSYFSDVGGQVIEAGPMWFPAIASVSLSALTLDLERFQVSPVTATVTFSPHIAREEFIDRAELGQATVTISAWRYDWRRREMRAFPVISAKATEVEVGYEGVVTGFRLAEDFDFNPAFPLILVDLTRFTRAQLGIGNQNDGGAMFRPYTFVYGNAQHVPTFELFPNETPEDVRYFLAGHNVKTLPTGPGSPARYKDLKNYKYIGVQGLSEPPEHGYTFKRAQQIKTAGDLCRKLRILAGYPDDRVDASFFEMCRKLDRFGAAGYVDDDGPLWDLFGGRYNQEYMCAVWQEAGTLRGCQINPAAEPTRALVINKDLLELDEGKVTELQKYTRFKVRYKFRGVPIGHSPAGSFGAKMKRGPMNPYLAELERRWGKKFFGSPVQAARHADSVDLPDVESDATAKAIIEAYARLEHRGQAASYLQFSEHAERVRLGDIVALVDPDRGYDEKPAVLISRDWVTPEFVINRFRTIEQFEQSARGGKSIATPPDGDPIAGSEIPTFGPGTGGPDSCWVITDGTLEHDGTLGKWVITDTGSGITVDLKCSCAPSGGIATIAWGIHSKGYGHPTLGGGCLFSEFSAGADCDHLTSRGVQGTLILPIYGLTKFGKTPYNTLHPVYRIRFWFSGQGSIWDPFISAPTSVIENIAICASQSDSLDAIT